MKDAVYGSAQRIGSANAMASDDSAPMTRSLWKPGESSSAERKADNMPCTEERRSMSAVPAALMINPRLNMACRRPAQIVLAIGLSSFPDF